MAEIQKITVIFREDNYDTKTFNIGKSNVAGLEVNFEDRMVMVTVELTSGEIAQSIFPVDVVREIDILSK